VQALSISEQQFRLAFQENPQPMWIFDLRSLRLLAANDAALGLFGFSASELMSQTASEIYAPEDAPVFAQDCARPCSLSDPPRLWRQRRKDGTRLHVELQARDLLYDKSPARLVVARDVG
jgi:PAS domain S-box-containing protein